VQEEELDIGWWPLDIAAWNPRKQSRTRDENLGGDGEADGI
jgi:hypothetical protein